MLRRALAACSILWLVLAPAWMALPLHVCPHTGRISITASCCDQEHETHGSCCTIVAESPDRAGPTAVPSPADRLGVELPWVAWDAPAGPAAAVALGLPPVRGPPRDPDRPPTAARISQAPTYVRVRSLRI